jgi:hypothetical protein
MKFKTVFVIIFLLLITFSCKNKLDLNAPYKEIPSIYAVFNPDDDIQIVRVNKVFLGEGDANEMAKIADSVNYPAGELTITLSRTESGYPAPAGSKSQVITFADSVIQAVSGAFNSTQRVYVCHEKLFPSGLYTLKVSNNKTGNVFIARDSSLNKVKPAIAPFVAPFYPVPPGKYPADDRNAYIDYSGQGTKYTIRFPSNNARIYQMVFRCHFYDSIGGSTEKTFNYVDYNFSNQEARSAEKIPPFTGYIRNELRGSDIFSSIGTALAKMNLRDPSTIQGRKMYKIQFLIYSSSQEYVDYMQYAAPSLNISQSKRVYSNFDNKAALGLFTFRTRFSVDKEMANFFIDEFAYNSNTRKYKFYTSDLRLAP